MWRNPQQVESHSRTGVDADGWIWQVEGDSEGETRTVLVEITGTARASAEAFLAHDTAAAIMTEGQSQIVRVLEMGNPPRVIQCGTSGCRDLRPDELSA